MPYILQVERATRGQRMAVQHRQISRRRNIGAYEYRCGTFNRRHKARISLAEGQCGPLKCSESSKNRKLCQRYGPWRCGRGTNPSCAAIALQIAIKSHMIHAGTAHDLQRILASSYQRCHQWSSGQDPVSMSVEAVVRQVVWVYKQSIPGYDHPCSPTYFLRPQ